ncbi:MAG TPA: tetratricopeptide repeat protein [Xanthobacteraceae bacterium]
MAFLTALTALTAGAVAGPVEDGNAAYQRGNYRTAVKILQPLVDQGNAEAQDILAVMYYVGQGLPQNRAQAIRLYRLSAVQGNAHAQDALGFAYQNGVGVQRDVSEAAKWFGKSADQDNIDAQFNLGEMYELGNGVPQDYVLAYMWFTLVASHGTRAYATRSIDRVAQQMSPEQIAEAQKRAREWKPTLEPKRQ